MALVYKRKLMMNRSRTLHKIFAYCMAFMLLVGSVPTVLNVSNASAQASCDTEFYNSNTIQFFNPCEVNVCSAVSGAVSGTISQLRGNNNGEKIFNFWLDAGMTRDQAAGITGSMFHEGGYSPFRQENSQSWPAGGWGIAQFTHDPGQRGDAVAYVKSEVGEAMFSQYYSNQYGGPVFLESGYIPAGVPEEVNEAFLIAQLNYLLDHIKGLVPNNTRWNAYNRDWSVEINSSSTLFDYLKTVTIPADAAKAWTYLYEYPGDIKATSVERAATADNIFALYTGSASQAGASCGGSVSDGGMNLEQAQAFMDIYSQIGTGDPNGDRQYINNTIGCHTNIDNCVVFSAYFVRKYTNINFVSGNGGWVVANTSAGNPGVEVGTVPKAYSVFSITKGTATCMVGGVERVCGHTGIVLGVDVANDKVITGEASWCDPSWTGAHEHSLSEWSNGDYSFLYAADYIKEERKAELN